MQDLTRPNGFYALSPQQQKEHRAVIGLRAQAILGQFWLDEDCPDAIRAIEIEGWMDVLQSCSQDEFRTAWAEYQRSGPRTGAGRLYKPDAGALYRIIVSRRPKVALAVVPKATEAPRIKCSAEAAKRIMAEVFGRDADPADMSNTLASAKRYVPQGDL